MSKIKYWLGVWVCFDLRKSVATLSLFLLITANQTKSSKLEQRSVIKYFVAENCKPCENYRICNVYRKTCFSQKNVFKWAKYMLVIMSLNQKNFL